MTHFFATRDDLLTVLPVVEQAVAVKYTLCGSFYRAELKTYASCLEIPDLGLATNESSVASDRYLVTLKDRRVRSRAIRENDGAERYRVDQLINPCSITLNPGGFWSEDILLHGVISTGSDDRESHVLLRRFDSQIRKSFHKIRVFWVGPQAEAFLDAGKRLTAAEQSPREYDLTRED